MNRCRTKFIWFINYTQFRCHNYLEPCEAYYAEKQVLRQTRSPGDFAPVSDMIYDFKREECIHNENVRTMNTLVAKMIRRYMEWVSKLQLC